MSEERQRCESPAERLNQAKAMVESVTTLIGAAGAVAVFIKGFGGPVPLLVEVGMWGFACYIGAIAAVPVVIGLSVLLERSADRSTTDAAQPVILGAAVVGFGAVIRLNVFHPSFSRDLNAIGTAFGVLLGAADLAIPLDVLWYFHGSEPNRR